jgi:hypothetical protein
LPETHLQYQLLPYGIFARNSAATSAAVVDVNPAADIFAGNSAGMSAASLRHFRSGTYS